MRNHFSLLSASRAVPVAIILAAAGLFTPYPAGAQSLSYTSGQNVSPAFEGWEEDAQGNRFFLFGYMNRNWQEEIDVPVGPDNSFNVGGADQGQPTHFLPRRNRFVFRVAAPKTFTEKDELIWTLTTHGKTEKAYATLRTDYKVDDVVKASETGALGAGTSSPEVRSNQPPTVGVEGPKTLQAKVGQPITIVALVKDDGIPRARQQGTQGRGGAGRRGDAAVSTPGANPTAGANPPNAAAAGANAALRPPSRITVGKTRGLHLSWFVYRGAGTVTFDPPQVKSWEDTRAGMNSPWAPLWQAPELPADGRISVRATFDQPGTYVLHGLADDGALTGSDVVTVTVTK